MISQSQWESMILYMRMVLDGYKGRFSFRSRQTHTLRVTQWAQRIWNENGEGADREVLLAATILHDIGYAAKGGEDHAEIGAAQAEQYLKNEGFEDAFVHRVCDCIRRHSKKELLKTQSADLTPELRILMEADLLDECGPVAIIFDCMAEGREATQSFQKTYQRIQKYSPVFLECNWMMNSSARQYWKDRQNLLKDFLEECRDELFLDEKMPEEYKDAADYMVGLMKGHNLVPNRQGIVFPFRQRDDHMFRVFYQARRLFKNEKARQKDRRQELSPYAKKVLSYAAILHDIGNRKTSDGLLHAPVGAEMAREYLHRQGQPEKLCQEVHDLIALHADKKLLTNPDTSLLLKLLMEADHQDESGALSIIWDAMASAAPGQGCEEAAFMRELDYISALRRIERFTVRMFEKCEYQTMSGQESWRRKGRFVDRFVQMLRFDLTEWEPGV